MGFQSGLSGLNAASQALEVTGNNVANASTVGFKQGRALFSDVYANSLEGAGAGQVGIGVRVSDVDQQFTQGAIRSTNNPLDVAINGNGFFEVSQNGTIFYSRAGQFHLDNAGYIVNPDGLQLMGYGVDANGNVQPSAPQPLQISSSQVEPTITTQFRANLNLESSETPPALAAFDPDNSNSFNASTSGSVYDSLGNSHVFSLYFVKTATAGQWEVQARVDGTAVSNVNLGTGAGNPAVINFNTSGALTSTMPLTTSLTVGGGAATPLAFSLDLTGTSQYGAPFSVNSLYQDGYTSGRLAGYSVGADGTITGRYTNGQTRNQGQIVLANFAAPTELKPLGNNRWEGTSAAGLAVVGTPGAGQFGVLQSGSVEESNVDLTAELVNLITEQRFYQANAQTIKTQDAILQTLVNLR